MPDFEANKGTFAPTGYTINVKAGRTQTNNAQLYLAEHYFEWLSQEKLLCAGDC